MLGEQPGDRAIPWGQTEDVLVRAPEQDMLDTWAWRTVAPCEDTCHHPVHAFKAPRGIHHLEWFTPGSPALTPAPSKD